MRAGEACAGLDALPAEPCQPGVAVPSLAQPEASRSREFGVYAVFPSRKHFMPKVWGLMDYFVETLGAGFVSGASAFNAIRALVCTPPPPDTSERYVSERVVVRLIEWLVR